jgi:hypothetical protein
MITIITEKTENAKILHKSGLFYKIKGRINKRDLSSLKKANFHILKDFLTDEIIEKILVGDLKELKSIHDKLPSYDPNPFKEDLEYIFDYKWFREGKVKNYDGFDLANNLGIDTCLYCNRNYTVSAKIEKKSKRVFPAYDHFMPKTDFPILALSFYNLIPVCTICNTEKGDDNPINERIFYPYNKLGIISEFKFNVEPTSYSFFRGFNSAFGLEYNITMDFLDKDVIEKSLDKFALIEIFNKSHKGLVSEIIIKSRNYNSTFRKYLAETLNLSKEEVYNLVFETYFASPDFHKRPFSKLKRDIFDQFNDKI